MITFNALMKSLNDPQNIIITPHMIKAGDIGKAHALTPDQLIHRLSGNVEDIVFKQIQASFIDPILSAALSQYSLISAQQFIEKNYDEEVYSAFITKFGLPPIVLLHNKIEEFVEKFLQIYCHNNIFVFDVEKYCPLFQNFIFALQNKANMKFINTAAYRPINHKHTRSSATILAPVFVCDAIELHCLQSSITVSREREQTLSYSSAYQVLNTFCDFYHSPSVYMLTPFLKMVLPQDIINKDKQFLPLCEQIYANYMNPASIDDFKLPKEVDFIRHVSLIDKGNVEAVISYLIYFTSLFDGFPKKRKRILEDYLLNESGIFFPDIFNNFDSIELISEIDAAWQFKNHVFILKNMPVSSYPIITETCTEIELKEYT